MSQVFKLRRHRKELSEAGFLKKITGSKCCICGRYTRKTADPRLQLCERCSRFIKID